MNEELAKMIGEAAREARQRAGLTQAEVASLVEITSMVYSRMERGKVMPSVPTVPANSALRTCPRRRGSSPPWPLRADPFVRPLPLPLVAPSRVNRPPVDDMGTSLSTTSSRTRRFDRWKRRR